MGHPQLSVRRQSELLIVNRNRLSPTARKATPEEMALCLEIDKLYMLRAHYGSLYLPQALRTLRLPRSPDLRCRIGAGGVEWGGDEERGMNIEG